MKIILPVRLNYSILFILTLLFINTIAINIAIAANQNYQKNKGATITTQKLIKILEKAVDNKFIEPSLKDSIEQYINDNFLKKEIIEQKPINTNSLKGNKNIPYGRMVPSGSSPYISPTEIRKKGTSINYFSVGIKTPIERTPPAKIVTPGEK